MIPRGSPDIGWRDLGLGLLEACRPGLRGEGAAAVAAAWSSPRDTLVCLSVRSAFDLALQALALLNNSFTLRMADHFAERLTKDRPGNPEQQVARAFELAYGRPANEAETQAGSEFVLQHGLSAFCRVLLNSNGFLYVD